MLPTLIADAALELASRGMGRTDAVRAAVRRTRAQASQGSRRQRRAAQAALVELAATPDHRHIPGTEMTDTSRVDFEGDRPLHEALPVLPDHQAAYRVQQAERSERRTPTGPMQGVLSRDAATTESALHATDTARGPRPTRGTGGTEVVHGMSSATALQLLLEGVAGPTWAGATLQAVRAAQQQREDAEATGGEPREVRTSGESLASRETLRRDHRVVRGPDAVAGWSLSALQGDVCAGTRPTAPSSRADRRSRPPDRENPGCDLSVVQHGAGQRSGQPGDIDVIGLVREAVRKLRLTAQEVMSPRLEIEMAATADHRHIPGT